MSETQKTVLTRGLLLLVGVVTTFGVFYYLRSRKVDYVISGIMSVSLYNDLDAHRTVNHSGVAQIVGLLRYWGEPVDVGNKEEIEAIEVLFDPVTGPKIDAMRNYFGKRGYSFDGEILRTPSDLKKYINPKTKTPLFFNITQTLDYPTLVDYRLLIGIRDSDKKLIFHHFTLGNNAEVSFEDFEKLWNTHPYSRFRRRYFIIRPHNFKERLASLSQNLPPYPPPSPLPAILRPILPDFTLGLRTTPDPVIRISHFEKLTSSPQFSVLHPSIQVVVYTSYGKAQIQAGRLQEALATLEKAESLNRDLDEPYGLWPRQRISRLSLPYGGFAMYYRALGDMRKADEYERIRSEVREQMEREVLGG